MASSANGIDTAATTRPSAGPVGAGPRRSSDMAIDFADGRRARAALASAERAREPEAEIVGALGVAAAAPALFAPAAILTVALSDGLVGAAGLVGLALALLGAAPLAAVAAIAAARPLKGRFFALAAVPLALAAAAFAWTSGGVLSPAAPWIYAALGAIALLGGVRAALASAGLAVAIGGALLLAPEPPVSLLGYAPRFEREAIAALSWTFATFSLASVAWAALTAWSQALPALRHPTIAARRALGALVEAGDLCGLRIDPDGRVLQALGASDRAIEHTRDDLAGLRLADLAHPDDHAALEKLVEEARTAAVAPSKPGPTKATPRKPAPLVLRLRSRLGGYRWVEAVAAPARAFPKPAFDRAGRAAGDGDVVLALRARWRPEPETGGHASSAREAEALAQMNGALRDGLKAVVGYTEILKNELFGPMGSGRYREYARLAHDGGSDLMELVEELLDFAEIEAGRYGARRDLADPVAIVEGAVGLLRARAERAGVELVADAPPNAPHVRIDRRALRRVLVNMLIDAVRAASVGDRVAVTARFVDEAMALRVTTTARKPGEAGAASVPATGERSPFAALGEAGLGRMVAQSLVERLGGALVFAGDLDGLGGADGVAEGAARLHSEAILPIEPAAAGVARRAGLPEAPARGVEPRLRRAEDRARQDAAAEAEIERRLARPLFAIEADPAVRRAPEPTDADALPSFGELVAAPPSPPPAVDAADGRDASLVPAPRAIETIDISPAAVRREGAARIPAPPLDDPGLVPAPPLSRTGSDD